MSSKASPAKASPAAAAKERSKSPEKASSPAKASPVKASPEKKAGGWLGQPPAAPPAGPPPTAAHRRPLTAARAACRLERRQPSHPTPAPAARLAQSTAKSPAKSPAKAAAAEAPIESKAGLGGKVGLTAYASNHRASQPPALGWRAIDPLAPPLPPPQAKEMAMPDAISCCLVRGYMHRAAALTPLRHLQCGLTHPP